MLPKAVGYVINQILFSSLLVRPSHCLCNRSSKEIPQKAPISKFDTISMFCSNSINIKTIHRTIPILD